MVYRVVGEAAMLAHFLFVAYVMLGGFLAWRWPRTIWLHVVAVAWGFSAVGIGFDCPLTDLENWARRNAGQAGLPPSGFIDHYLTGVVYPEDQVLLARTVLVVCVFASWIGFVWLRRRRRARVLAGAGW